MKLLRNEKKFSRSNSLRHRLQHVIGTHNIGYLKFYTKVNDHLGILTSQVQTTWLTRRDNFKIWKSKKEKTVAHKRRRKFKTNAKIAEELYEERTANIKTGKYGHGIGTEKENQKVKKKRKASIPCGCGGSSVHYRSNSKHCLRNKISNLKNI